ncbi:MAG: tetratricopeptide repeat-containing glycosyltransferase [Turicibacter sp.]
MKFKICVYAICKNEARFVDRWMNSMGEADLIVVTDTGSTDDTVNRLRKRGATVFVESIKPWRFDTARNVSLGHVPEDVDICVCTDLDEIFEPGWRNKLEKAWSKNVDQGKYLYNWSLHSDGTPNIQFTYFKVHKRQEFIWKYPIHEVLNYVGTEQLVEIYIDGMILNHYPDSSKSRGNYLQLLEIAVLENPNDDRMTYYLGREYMYLEQWKKCILTLKKHLSLETATWREERCASMRWIAHSYQKIGKIQEAYAWYYKAIAELPSMRDPYIEFAKLAYREEDWLTTYYLVQESLKIRSKSTSYVNMGYSWDYTPYDLGAISSYHLGMYKLALEYAKEALRLNSKDERLIDNVKIIKNKLC